MHLIIVQCPLDIGRGKGPCDYSQCSDNCEKLGPALSNTIKNIPQPRIVLSCDIYPSRHQAPGSRPALQQGGWWLAAIGWGWR